MEWTILNIHIQLLNISFEITDKVSNSLTLSLYRSIDRNTVNKWNKNIFIKFILLAFCINYHADMSRELTESESLFFVRTENLFDGDRTSLIQTLTDRLMWVYLYDLSAGLVWYEIIFCSMWNVKCIHDGHLKKLY